MSTEPTERTLRAVYTDTDDLDPTAAIATLEAAGFEVARLETRDADAIVEAAADADALLVGYAPITAEMIERMPRLKLIATLSMGVDMVDVDAASERGIWVANVLGAATDEVAAHALALALAARSLTGAQHVVRQGGWRLDDDADTDPAPPATTESVLGIVGLGRIGRRLAEFARPMFGEILATDPVLPDDGPTRAALAAEGIRRVGLDELLSRSDVVSLHLPLTDETAGLVDDAFLAKLAPGAVLVNVSRGGLVDERALLAALDAGRLAGAGLDVLEAEPPAPHHPFRTHPRVVLTPHIAYRSDRTGREYTARQAANVIEWAAAGRPVSPVNAPAAAVATR
ncbi:C-terminal binding protein [Agromyces sp. NPDC058104]|uniref:C-terminal binding protein n=1 Tax=Agromyces sp. NPDC058104 TaxID=3346342 RepID=UPI0036DF80FA